MSLDNVRKKDEAKKKVIIAGCGRMGSSIAGALSEKGYHVTIVDYETKAFRKLRSIFSGFELQGDATDVDVLKKAGIKDADIMIAATNRDNVNSMIAQIASTIFNVEEVYARFYDFDKEHLCVGTNIKGIYPARLSLEEFERLSSIDMD